MCAVNESLSCRLVRKRYYISWKRVADVSMNGHIALHNTPVRNAFFSVTKRGRPQGRKRGFCTSKEV